MSQIVSGQFWRRSGHVTPGHLAHAHVGVPRSLTMQINPVIAKIQASPKLSAVPIGDTTLGVVLGEQIHIGIVGTGPMSTRALEPQTPAAEQALKGASGRRLERMLHGVMAELDGREGASELTGFSLATSTTGFAADMLVNHIALKHPLVTELNDDWSDGKMSPPVNLDRVTAKTLATLASAAQVTNDRFAPVFTGQTQDTMVLGPQVSGFLLRMARNPRDTSDFQDATYGAWNTRDLVHDVLHEAHHAITPLKWGRQFDEWIEEGTADVLATWPGATEAGAARMGITLTSEPSHEDNRFYPEWAASLRTMLGLAGIDPTEPSQRSAAADLLQDVSVDRVPTRLTQAIMRHNKLAPDMRATVKQFVVAGDADQLAAVISAGQQRA